MGNLLVTSMRLYDTRTVAKQGMVIEMTEVLTKERSDYLKVTVTDSCGWLACMTVDKIFEDARFHGNNLVYTLVNEEDHLVVILDSDCSNKSGHAIPKEQENSTMTALCDQGVVLYYYHSIEGKHHHVCLALKKQLVHGIEQIPDG